MLLARQLNSILRKKIMIIYVWTFVAVRRNVQPLHSPCALIHLPPLPIEAWETSVVAAAAAIFWQLLMDAGNTNERFNDSQAVLVSAMIAYIFSIYQRKFAPFAHKEKWKHLQTRNVKCGIIYFLNISLFSVFSVAYFAGKSVPWISVPWISVPPYDFFAIDF